MPRVIGGMMEMPVRGNLEISGWALARAGAERIEIAVDGTPIALADYGMRRLDIQAAFPDWDNSLASGFLCLVPHRLLPKGPHTVTVALRDRAGKTAGTEFRIEVEALSELTGPWSLRRKMAQAEIDLDLRLLERRQCRPQFTALLPLRTDAESLSKARATIASLTAQIYPDWRLIVVPQGSGKKSAMSDTTLHERLTDRLPSITGRVEIERKPERAFSRRRRRGTAPRLSRGFSLF
jgi:hypothetical protein